MNGAGETVPEVDSIELQKVCPIDLSEHLSITYSRDVAQIVMNTVQLFG